MEGRRRAAQFATLARMCSPAPALTFVADGDGSEGWKGRRLCGLAISQDGREMEENKSIRLPVRCCYMAAFPLPPFSGASCTTAFPLSLSPSLHKREVH